MTPFSIMPVVKTFLLRQSVERMIEAQNRAPSVPDSPTTDHDPDLTDEFASDPAETRPSGRTAAAP